MKTRHVLFTLALVLLPALLVGYLAKTRWDGLRTLENYEHQRRWRSLGIGAWYLKLIFDTEVEALGRSLDAPGDTRQALAEELAARRQAWLRQSRWPGIAGPVYLVAPGSDSAPRVELLREDPATFDPVPDEALTPALEALRERAAREAEAGASDPLGPRRGSAFRVAPELPAMLLETRLLEPGGLRQAWLAVSLDRDYLRDEFLPDLVELTFAPPNHEGVAVAVVETAGGALLFSTEPVDSFEDFGRADAAYGLVDAGTDGEELPHIGSRPPRDLEAIPNQTRPPTAEDHIWFRHLWARNLYSGHWQLYARRGGVSVADEVAEARLRAWMTSMVALGLLATAVIGVILFARRTQRRAARRLGLVAGISHELRTPLAVLTAAGDNLADSVVRDPERLTEYGRLIQGETLRLREMTENVLHLARQRSEAPPLEKGPLDLAELVRDCLRRMRRQLDAAGITVQEELPPDPVSVHGHRGSLQTAVFNLLSNALKYGGSSRWLRVSLASKPGADGDQARLEVEDRGPGVDPAEAERIFEPFVRGANTPEEAEGSGLGLSVVRDVARDHGGRVKVDSRPGRGSVFVVQLPLAPEGAAG